MMSNKTANETRALSSEDGQTWDFNEGNVPVSKVVIGEPPRSGEEVKKVTLAGELLTDLAEHWDSITHLYLWGVENVEELLETVKDKAWPEKLECLDLRGSRVKEISSLPKGLLDLDLGYCEEIENIPRRGLADLRRFYLENCKLLSVRSLSVFIEDCECLEELSLEGCEQIGELYLPKQSLEDPEGWIEKGGNPKFPPMRFKKLVLKGCNNLKNLPDLSEYPWLHHLNLENCSALEKLPDIPDGLQYLLLHGANKLTQFLNQGIGAYDRGDMGSNVANRIHSRKKYGEDLSIEAHAKLLLLGNGRVGKSTLAKSLQWHSIIAKPEWAELDEEERRAIKKDFKPHDNELPTHKMQVWQWRAPLCLNEEVLQKRKLEATAADLEWPESKNGDLEGQIGIWDFGGQEIYHNTHRIFAGQGSVFLIVWSPEKPDQEKLEQDKPDGVTMELWLGMNESRPLEYWLDYVYSINQNAEVALVSPRCEKGVDWRQYAPRFATKKLDSFFLDSCSADCAESAGYLGLTHWLKEALGRKADEQVGLIQPRFFADTANYVNELLEENSKAFNAEQEPEYLMKSWPEWSELLAVRHKVNELGIDLNSNDIEAISGYLDDSGHIKQLSNNNERVVLIDQSWGTSLIYEILKPGGIIHRIIIQNGGWFVEAELEKAADWKLLDKGDGKNIQKEQLLNYMVKSGILIPYVEGDDEVLYIANEKWLLPSEKKLSATMLKRLNLVTELPDADVVEEFEFEHVEVSEVDFRRLMSYLGKLFGVRALWFQGGVQVMSESYRPEWCFRIRWENGEDNSYFGKLDAQLNAKADMIESLREKIEDVFSAKDCPLVNNRLRKKEITEGDLSHFYFNSKVPKGKIVGISSRGVDSEDAASLQSGLKTVGIFPLWYLDEECREGEYAKVYPFMKKLCVAETIIIFLSDAYLANDPESNWYCLWELADTMIKLCENKRSAQNTIVVYKPGDDVNSGNLDDILLDRFERFAQYFDGKYSELKPADKLQQQYYNDIAMLFARAKECVSNFYNERGTLGKYDIIGERKNRDFSKLIKTVEDAVNSH